LTVVKLKPSRREQRKPLRIAQEMVDSLNRAVERRERPTNPFALDPRLGHPPGVGGRQRGMAMDEALGAAAWSYESLTAFKSAYLEGQMFLGFPTLAAMSQRAEYMTPIATIADDMTRNWIKLKAAAELGKGDQIKKLEDKLTALNLREVVKEAIKLDGTFGRGHIYLDTGDTDNRDELKTDLGDGARSATSAFKMAGLQCSLNMTLCMLIN
jgi:uncharacterized protein